MKQIFRIHSVDMGGGISRKTVCFEYPEKIVYIEKHTLILHDITNNIIIKRVDLPIPTLCCTNFEWYATDRLQTKLTWKEDEKQIIVTGIARTVQAIPTFVTLFYDSLLQLRAHNTTGQAPLSQKECYGILDTFPKNIVLHEDTKFTIFDTHLNVETISENKDEKEKQIQINPKHKNKHICQICYDVYENNIIICVQYSTHMYLFEVWKKIDNLWKFQYGSSIINFKTVATSYHINSLKCTKQYLLVELLGESSSAFGKDRCNAISVLTKKEFIQRNLYFGTHPTWVTDIDDYVIWLENYLKILGDVSVLSHVSLDVLRIILCFVN